MYINRNAENLFKRYLSLFPCICITGPRQSGKSTMIRHILPETEYISFDYPDEEYAFHSDPKGFMNRFKNQVIFDQVQRVPKLFRYIKISVDADPQKMGRFILSGSNQLSMLKNISESLAGRIGLLSLLPFEYSELPGPIRDKQILYGSYPALAIRDYRGARDWFSSYFGTYLEKDIRLVFDIGNLSDFQTLVRLLGARCSQEFNASSFSKEIGITSNTVERWTSVLRAGYIIFQLSPFHGNIGKRLIKRPKVYFWDTGFICYLTGINDMEGLIKGPLYGALFENLIISELQKKCIHQGLDRSFYFYRDSTGNELDLIIHDKDKKQVLCYEIKTGQTAKQKWADNLLKTSMLIQNAFSIYPIEIKRKIIYQGDTKKNFPKEGIDFVNYKEII